MADNTINTAPRIENVGDTTISNNSTNGMNMLDIAKNAPVDQTSTGVAQQNKDISAMLSSFHIVDGNSYTYDPGNQYDADTGTYSTPGYH